jgi:hypothetical protein
MRRTVGFGGAMRLKYSPRYQATDVDQVLSDIANSAREAESVPASHPVRGYAQLPTQCS